MGVPTVCASGEKGRLDFGVFGARGRASFEQGLSVDLGLTDGQSIVALLFWSPVSPVVELRVSSRAPWNPPPGLPLCGWAETETGRRNI